MLLHETCMMLTAKLFKLVAITLALGFVGLNLMLPAPAQGQVTGATLSGTLSDPSGAAIPNAQFLIKNLGTGIITTTTTNASGFYTAPNLISGSYEMRVTAPGFSTEVLTKITLEVGAQVVKNITLKVGQTAQSVEVTSDAPGVELASSTMGAVVGHQAVVDLPLNGRSWTDLALLQPGTSLVTTQNALDNLSNATGRAFKGFGAQNSINGARPPMNNYRQDGISISDYTNGAPSNVIGETPGVDSVQEFSVLTSNYSAEYGNTAGGVINAITRSGTNGIHGSAYEFIRNNALDARNYFDSPVIPAFRRNQFGASIGGPIIKDRTFFFANYEGLRQLKGLTIVNVVPSLAARSGKICSAPSSATACTPSTVEVDPAAAAYLPFYPLPNAGLVPKGNGDTGYFNFALPQDSSDNFFTTRVDHKFSDKDSIAGTFMIDRGPFTMPDPFNQQVFGFSNNRQFYAFTETHIFTPNLVNVLRVGAFRQFADAEKFVSAINPLVTDTTLGYLSGLTASQVKISGLADFSGGQGAFGYTSWGYTTPQFYDDASWVHGTHSIKFGFASELQRLDFDGDPAGAKWSFGSLTNFLTNKPSGFTAQPQLVVSAERKLRDKIFGGYVQDDWRYRPYLTFNLGLRYEMMTNPTEANGFWTALPSITATAPRLGNPFYESNPTVHNFAPRVGFVWDPFHDSKSSVRGGFGIFDSMPEVYQFPRGLAGLYPYQIGQSTSAPPAGSFYNKIASTLTNTSNIALYLQQNPKRTYVMQWNLSVQREIAQSLTATLAYAGSTGVHLPFDTNGVDSVTPTLTSAGWLYPSPIGSGTRVNPNFGQIVAYQYIAHSSYHSLQALVSKRMSHGFQVQGSFTWGKGIDNNSSNTSTKDFANALAYLPLFDQRVNRGLSDFNVSQTLVINALWQLPEAKALPRFAGRLVNGWQVGGIFRATAGTPFTPTFGSGGNVPGILSGAPTSGFPNRLTGPGCDKAVNPRNSNNYINLSCFSLPTAPDMAFWNANCDHTSKIYGSPATTAPYPICLNLMGNAGRNSLVGPGVSNLDFSVFKNNKIGENFNVQFRAEAFNMLNRTNFAIPSNPTNTDLYNAAGVPSGSAGVLTATSTASRQLQFAVKMIW